jgi:hypothetical protein
MSSQEQPSTCGQGLALNAALPAAFGRVLDSIAEVLDTHTHALVQGDAAAEAERKAYVELRDQHRRIAGELAELAHRMERCRDLPMAAHDESSMSAPAAMVAFETSVKFERELAELLEQRIEAHQHMLIEWLALLSTDDQTK